MNHIIIGDGQVDYHAEEWIYVNNVDRSQNIMMAIGGPH